MIKTLKDFVVAVDKLSDIHDAYDIFEDDCSEDLRGLIYKLADQDTPEPFRSAMYNIGFTQY